MEIGQLKVVDSPTVLVGIALGSCAGLMLYDERHRIAGLAHIMLPLSTNRQTDSMPAKFADLAVLLMLERIEELGGRKTFCRAKLAGGAKMFLGADHTFCQVGARNIKAVKTLLAERSIPLMAEDTGGDYARTVEFNTEDFRVSVKSIAHGRKWM